MGSAPKLVHKLSGIVCFVRQNGSTHLTMDVKPIHTIKFRYLWEPVLFLHVHS